MNRKLGKGLSAIIKKSILSQEGESHPVAVHPGEVSESVNANSEGAKPQNLESQEFKSQSLGSENLRSQGVGFAAAADTASDGSLAYLPAEYLQRGRYQPRREIDPESLLSLSDSIKEQGVMQPIVIRKIKPAGTFGVRLGKLFRPKSLKKFVVKE